MIFSRSLIIFESFHFHFLFSVIFCLFSLSISLSIHFQFHCFSFIRTSIGSNLYLVELVEHHNDRVRDFCLGGPNLEPILFIGYMHPSHLAVSLYDHIAQLHHDDSCRGKGGAMGYRNAWIGEVN